MTDSPKPGENTNKRVIRVPMGRRVVAPPAPRSVVPLHEGAIPSLTGDSFQNFTARIGIGTDNVASEGTYGFNPITRNRQLLEFMYRSSWVIGKIVDTPAEDMCRAGVNIRGKFKPDELDKMNRGAARVCLWDHIESGITWSRLYGGCLLVALVDGQDLATPLDLRTVKEGQFKGIIALDRWMVEPSFNQTVTDFGPDLGKPMFYRCTANATALQGQSIHYSRVVRLDGRRLPFWQSQAENFWGMSEVERIHDRLLAYDSTTQGAAQLVYKAYLRTYKVKGLREIIGMADESPEGGMAYAGLLMQMEMIRKYQTNEGLTLMDAEDEMSTFQYSFGGLADVLGKFGEQLSGATGIPLIRMFGQSPSGFSTGEADLQNYYDLINAAQNSKLKSGITFFYDLLYRSECGGDPPEDYSIEFASLWQMSDKERAEVAASVTDTIARAADAGFIDTARGATELMNASDRIGLFGSMTEQEVAAIRQNPPEGEFDDPPAPGETGEPPRDRSPLLPEEGDPDKDPNEAPKTDAEKEDR